MPACQWAPMPETEEDMRTEFAAHAALTETTAERALWAARLGGGDPEPQESDGEGDTPDVRAMIRAAGWFLLGVVIGAGLLHGYAWWRLA